MLQGRFGHLLSARHCVYLAPRNVRFVASSAHDASGEDEVVAARKWLANFNFETIPREVCTVSFSRSSGPGGQNVNKVNSKATLRLPLSSLLPLLPKILHPEIRSSRYCTKADCITIQSDENRKQGDNIHSCFARLHDEILEAGRRVVPGETTEAQQQKVIRLQKADNAARLKSKKTHSMKKSARRSDPSEY